MNRIATHSRNSARITVLVVAAFVALLAIPGYSEDSNAEAIINAKVAPASVNPVHPFSGLAIGVNVGTLGIGGEIATPLTRHSNLRVDGYLLNYAPSLTRDGVNYYGDIHLRDIRASYDYFPFRGGFHISGGVAMYNKLNIAAIAKVPANDSITLNETPYYSSAADPLHGNASIAYSHKIAPTATIGWGNALPRGHRHFSFPVELGAAFTGAPKFDMAMSGSACQSTDASTCAPIATYSDFQTNLTAEKAKITKDIAPFRVYPIFNFGVSYRF